MALSRMWLASEECEGPRLRPVPRSRAIRAPYVLRLSPVSVPLCCVFAAAVRAIVVVGGEGRSRAVAQLSHLSP